MSSDWQVSTLASFAEEQRDRVASRRGSPDDEPPSAQMTTDRFNLHVPSPEDLEEYMGSGADVEAFLFNVQLSYLPPITVTSLCSDFYKAAGAHGGGLVVQLERALALSECPGKWSEVAKLRMLIRVFRQVLVAVAEVMIRIVVVNCRDRRNEEMRLLVDNIDAQMGSCQRLFPVESYGSNASQWPPKYCRLRRKWCKNGMNFDELGNARLGSWVFLLHILMTNYNSLCQWFTRMWRDNFFDQEEPIRRPRITTNCEHLSLINILFRLLGPVLGQLPMGYDEFNRFYGLLISDGLLYTLRHSGFLPWGQLARPPVSRNPLNQDTTDWPFKLFSLEGDDELHVSIRQRLETLLVDTKAVLPRFDESALKRGLKTYPLPAGETEKGLIRDIWKVMRDKIRRWMASHGEASEDLSENATHPSKWPVIDRLGPRAALRWASGYAYLAIALAFDQEQDVILIKGQRTRTEKCRPYTILATLEGMSFRIPSDFLLMPVVTLQRP